MTLTQLEYIVAVDTWHSFTDAAHHCFVTQPTLSMQIQKLEHELGIVIFDRSRAPVVATDEGRAVIDQARVVLHETNRLKENTHAQHGTLAGELRIGIIPTLAPYLVPRFLPSFLERYPNVRLTLTEVTTTEIVDRLKTIRLDGAILATPLDDGSLREEVLFREEFFVYASADAIRGDKAVVRPKDLITDRLWLLEEGHCMRSQMTQICTIRERAEQGSLHYDAGGIETLIRMVDTCGGVTIVPELAFDTLDARQRRLVRRFAPSAPAREISLVCHRSALKRRLLDGLRKEIVGSLPGDFLQRTKNRIVPPVL